MDDDANKGLEDIATDFAWEYSQWVYWFRPTKEDFRELDKKWHFFTAGTSDNDIAEIVALREQQGLIKRREYLKDKVAHLKKSIGDHLIQDLVDQKLGASASVQEKAALRNKLKQALEQIDVLVEDGNGTDDIAEVVQQVLEGKYVPEKKKGRNFKKYWSYIWTIGVDVISLFVLFAIYNSTDDNQQRLILSILMLIYLAIRTLGMGIGWSILQGFVSLDEQFRHLRALLNEEPSGIEKEKAKNTEKALSEWTIKSFINGTFLTIAYLATIWILLSSL
jgi:hypothetical protein